VIMVDLWAASPAKSSGLVVNSGKSAAIPVEAIIKSATLWRRVRPAAVTVAVTGQRLWLPRQLGLLAPDKLLPLTLARATAAYRSGKPGEVLRERR
jgi:hypothetical protein